ncbi:MAG TPA: hypothetical protein VMQ46_09645 [Acidimicrobiia bacterium]|nr:hypothetical protein [Acidimicrobiia bacterium]
MTASRRVTVLIAALAMTFSVVMIAAEEAGAAPPDPQVAYLFGRAETTPSGCTYQALWSISGVNGRWAQIAIEERTDSSADFVPVSTEQHDLHESLSFEHAIAVPGLQPGFYQFRVRVEKKNGSPLTDWSTSAQLVCAGPSA